MNIVPPNNLTPNEELIWSIKNKSLEYAKKSIEKGADVNIQYNELYY